MDHDDSWGLLKGILGVFARKSPERLTPPASLRSQTLDAWVRADACLQHETKNFDEIDPEQVESTLITFENLVQYDSDQEPDSAVEQSLHHTVPYPKLQAIRSTNQRPNRDAYPDSGLTIRISKRKRKNDAAIEELSRLEMEAKKRRVLPREEPNVGDDMVDDMVDDMDDPEADIAILMRKYSVSLHQRLRTRWTCVCQKCSGSQMEACFEVFFGVRSPRAITLHEAKITVKDVQNGNATSPSELVPSVLPEFAYIYQCITESLDQRNCLNLLFEDGLFKGPRPQPKTFGDSQMPRIVSLSALFKRQQELRGGSSVLPLKEKRILAVILAEALLPFLETPWVQPSFNHSNIQFLQPLHGKLPDITKPFLAIEKAPIISGNKMDTRNSQAEPASSKHMVHPHAKSWQNDTKTARNVNTDYYTSLDILKNLEVDAGVDYYLATKACLQWEYFPAEELTTFESASVQRLFYRNVVERLESEIFKSWRIRESRSCPPTNKQRIGSLFASGLKCDVSELCLAQSGHASVNTDLAHSEFQTRSHLTDSSTKSLYFFDASHHTVSEQDTELSERWMNSLLSSIYHHVDSFDAAMQPSAGSIENGSRTFKPVRIAILDSRFDPKNPLLLNEDQRLDPRIKRAQNFVLETESLDIQDEVGHGTHALGLLLKVATCAEIYIARVANQETLGRDSYDTITKARLATY
ncbi:hypothetical protein E0Z10_g1082 [Xylaria hypoxylon]|uniref:DUF7580 domain-containing protein n=1 Tax=Xylaria hypoxylon TaxID=37992 RepID=A0A4Z0Z9N7_9PEZI|nr:hypothetical protein E0Z10_g1082 [Xylaria hypoxylon]